HSNTHNPAHVHPLYIFSLSLSHTHTHTLIQLFTLTHTHTDRQHTDIHTDRHTNSHRKKDMHTLNRMYTDCMNVPNTSTAIHVYTLKHIFTYSICVRSLGTL